MAKHAQQKEKLLLLLDYFQRETDEQHPVTAPELIQMLARNGIAAERKSIYDDIATLQARGYDILSERRRGYYLAGRDFELAELKLLVDAVQSSKFISAAKSRSLITKLETLCSRHEAGALQRQVYVSGRPKTMNEAVLYSIDAIHEAVSRNRQLSFRYFDYDRNKRPVFRHDGKVYTVSPVGLLRNDEFYYLVALEQGRQRHYRVDRISSPQVLELSREEGCGAIDLTQHAQAHFGMFSGDLRTVRLRCPNRFSHTMLDRFGMDTMLIPDGDTHFTLTAEVAVSDQFFGWLFALGEVELLSPEEVRSQYTQRLRAALSLVSD